MREIAAEQAKKFLGQVWDDVLGYLRLYDYAKIKAKAVVAPAKTLRSPSAFWLSILGDRFAGEDTRGFERLRDGDVVKMKNLFISEWAPKLPGRAWTVEGMRDFAEVMLSDEVKVLPVPACDISRLLGSVIPGRR